MEPMLFDVREDEDEGLTVVCVTTRAGWVANQCQDDYVSADVEHLLEDEGFESVMEATFLTDLPPEEARGNLLALGFEEDAEFSNFMSERLDL